MDILPIFCELDDFCQAFLPRWQQHLLSGATARKRHRASALSLSEVMTIIVLFHSSGFRTFKDFYTQHMLRHGLRDFPHLTSYNRFVELMPAAVTPLAAYLETRFAECRGRVVHRLDLSGCVPQPPHLLAEGLSRSGRAR